MKEAHNVFTWLIFSSFVAMLVQLLRIERELRGGKEVINATWFVVDLAFAIVFIFMSEWIERKIKKDAL